MRTNLLNELNEVTGRVFSMSLPPTTMGLGARKELPRIVGELGRNVLIVTDTGVAATPLFAEIVAQLSEQGIRAKVFAEVMPDPSDNVVYSAAAAAAEHDLEVLLGVGGGSSLDATKIAAVLLKHRRPIDTLYGTDQVPGRGAPTVLVPTTAGTGSEVTPISVLTDTTIDLKRGIVSDFIVPTHAVVDPQMCISLPPEPTAYTGMDALTHAIEGYANRFPLPLIDSMALETVRLTGRYLSRAFHDGSDEEARYGMSRASLLGGYCLGPVNTGAVHALAYPLSGQFHVPHGAANALLLPHVMRFNAPVVESRYAEIATALGVDDAVEAIEELSAEVGTNRRMRDYGVCSEDLARMVADAMKVQRLLTKNPRDVTKEDALAIYEAAL